MIVDYLKNLHLYTGVNKNLSQISKFFAEHDVKSLEKGKYQLEDDCFVNILESNPTDSTKFEAHVKYLDVQLILKGSETIRWQTLSLTDKTTDYDDVKDRFFMTAKESEKITLVEDMFMILFPEDAHCPGIKAFDDSIKKAVFKIKA